MVKNFINFKRLEKLSKGSIDSNISLTEKMVKLFEEGGELSQAVLKYVGSPTSSASGGETKEHVLEECMDSLNIILDIINYFEFSQEECVLMFDKKLDKWENKIKSHKKI